MRIAFYAPFKPLDHPRPSGDQIIGRGLFTWFGEQGHQVRDISRLRSRWIYWHPLQCAKVVFELPRILTALRREPVDCWFTHHCYYKAPDLLGPTVCRKMQIPYVLFQPSFATKYRRKLKTFPGYYLNRWALSAADHAITNRRQDLKDLARIFAAKQLLFVPPGLSLERFIRDEEAGKNLRQQWQVGERPVIVTAAMFRDDVKSLGLARVLESCRRLHERDEQFVLAIAGDGCKRPWLEGLAHHLPGDMVRFVGQLQPEAMRAFYSAGDVFVFPGINESLGMVYLEAQACGLPVVAYANGGISGVVDQGKTGFLTELDNDAAFDSAILRLLHDRELRLQMGKSAMSYVQVSHDQQKNYQVVEKVLQDLLLRQRHERTVLHEP